LRHGHGSRERQNTSDNCQTLHGEESFRCRAVGPLWGWEGE
jgi:hypothetical protein